MEQQQNIALLHQFYMHDEERMSSKEISNSEQQLVQQSSLQLPVQRIKRNYWNNTFSKMYKNMSVNILNSNSIRGQRLSLGNNNNKYSNSSNRMKHQHMMVMEQLKRAVALSGGTGGMMYSTSLPPPQSHKVLTILSSVMAAAEYTV